MKVRVVIDVEMCRVHTKNTTYPYKNEIIQIGAVLMNENYEIQSEFSTYVKPQFGKVDYYISMLTGISERTLKNAPHIEEALTQMLNWIGSSEVVFYSWSDTDYYQIRNEIQQKCDEDVRWERLLNQANWIDYQRKLGDRLESYKLLRLTEALDLAEVDTSGKLHDGLDDALNTARMIAKLETNKDYRTIIERLREKEKSQEPLTTPLGGLLQGLLLETA